MSPIDYYRELQRVLPGEHRTIGNTPQIVPAICPFCAKSNEAEFHSSYGPIFGDGDYGFKCFSCGTAKGLGSLYSELTGKVPRGVPAVAIKPSAKRSVAYWRKNSDSLLASFTRHPQRFEAWNAYKKITPEVVEKYSLGLGKLPQSRYNDTRLIVPIMQSGSVVMLRGRRITGDGPKWTAAGGVSPADIQLPFAEYVNSDIIFIVENPIDAVLVNEYSKASAVAALSTNYWYPHWTARLKELKPSIVITAYDFDIAGEGGTDVAQVIKIAKERIVKIFVSRGIELDKITVTKVETNARGWRISWQSGEHEGVLPIPAPAGVQRRNELLKAGISVASMPWGEVGDKCDIGDLYLKEIANEN